MEKLHLFILVHGLQGHSLDLKYLKNIIVNIYPKSVVLVSTANQDDTETIEIEAMGVKLANEIKHFFLEFYRASRFDK